MLLATKQSAEITCHVSSKQTPTTMTICYSDTCPEHVCLYATPDLALLGVQQGCRGAAK